MKENKITVGITAHAEQPGWLRRAFMSVLMQQDAPDFEIIISLDRADDETAKEALSLVEKHGGNARAICVDFGDLGMSRNAIIAEASTEYVCFVDGDDLFGALWLRQAYDYAKSMPHQNFVLHPEVNIFFGQKQFIHKHIGDDDPAYDAKDMVQYNAWSAHAFAPLEVFKKFPYRRAERGLGYEDYQFNVETLGACINHSVVKDSAHFIRIKGDNRSMASRYVADKLVIPYMALFDRRDLPDAKEPHAASLKLSQIQHQQVLFAHKNVGERQIVLKQDTKLRHYPRSRCWKDQAWLRDHIGSGCHLVMVQELVRGGAEKYAMDWAESIKNAGKDVVLLETRPVNSPWLQQAESRGLRVVRWVRQNKDLSLEEQFFALQRALIQCRLESLFVCNSPDGWAVLFANPQPLAKKVFAASFAPIPLGMGYESCPPYHFHVKSPPNFKIITDNHAHAETMREYNGVPVEVIPPICRYAGPSKKSQIEKKRFRVLWAGRGTPEKNPGILPALAALLEDHADIHVWGDVQPMNGPESLKYRGPFDGFDKIDGSYDCYINTSLNEGMPHTAMEAVMADLPVIAPPVGGLPLVSVSCELDPPSFAKTVIEVCRGVAAHGVTGAIAKERVIDWAEDAPKRIAELVS